MTIEPKTHSLLREAAEWRLIGLLFECPSKNWKRDVASLSSELDNTGLAEASAAALEEAAEGLYHSVFGPGGPAPAREASYHDTVQLGYLISELECYYSAFAYTPQASEAVDHVAVEAGFIGYLRLKEAYAIAGGEPESAAIAADAARRFIDDHLSLIAEPLSTLLAESGVRYLALAARDLFSRVGPRKLLPVLNPAAAGNGEEGCFECGSD